ncbi:hypothetical protein D3C75_794600 [compost metagenome]
MLEVHFIGEACAHETAQADGQERPARQQAHVEFRCVLADKRRQQHRQDPQRGHGKTGPGRGVAQSRLQPLRQNQVDPEEPGIAQDQHDGAVAEVAMGEQAQVDHRVFVGHFPDHEERQGHHRNHRADHDEAGFEPVGIVALVEHDLQRPDTDDQRDQTDVIHRLAAGDHRALFHLLGDHPCREQADRHVDEENPRPAVAVGDPAAEDRPGNRRDHRDHRQQR